MASLLHAILLVAVFIVLALVGQFLVNRVVEEEVMRHHHSAGEAMMGVVGTLFSVLLGFMVAAAMERYQEAQMHGEQEASQAAGVFRIARGLSDEDRPRLRQLVREYIQEVIDKEWPEMERGEPINHGWQAYRTLWEAVVAVVPENDRQSNLHQGLIAAMQSLGDHRRARVLLGRSGMPTGLWIIVAMGAVITISLSYVFASRFPRVQGFMTTLMAAALALNIWLLSAFSHPFSGDLKIHPRMFLLVKEQVLTIPDTPSRFLHDGPAGN